MNSSNHIGILSIALLASLALGGCTASRGDLLSASCAAAGRTPLPVGSLYALYLDKDGKVLGTQAEDLTGTARNQMCPTPAPDAEDPGVCSTGYCPRRINPATVICLRC